MALVPAGQHFIVHIGESARHLRLPSQSALARGRFVSGQVAEWFKATVLKTVVGGSSPWVRIPPCPPLSLPDKSRALSGRVRCRQAIWKHLALTDKTRLAAIRVQGTS